MGQRAKVELDMRERPGVRGGTTAGLEKAGVRTPEVEAQLAELKAKSAWEQEAFMEKGGWAKMPGTRQVSSGVARACAEIIVAGK